MKVDIHHHLDAATLLAYSAGSLGEALSAVAAAHFEMCAHCRSELRDCDLIGAMLFDALPVKSDSRMKPCAMPPATATVVALGHRQPASAQAPGQIATGLPTAVIDRIGVDLDTVRWRRLGPGIWHFPVKLSDGVVGDLRLLKIAAGKRMPGHGHGGTELTLVLNGAFEDEKGRYSRGDIQDIDGDAEHRPIADATEGCVCLIASEQPARYKSLINRLLQPLTGI